MLNERWSLTIGIDKLQSLHFLKGYNKTSLISHMSTRAVILVTVQLVKFCQWDSQPPKAGRLIIQPTTDMLVSLKTSLEDGE
ncbi:hypothetical protein PR048_022704, partial [Dryococelus australis]